MLQLNIMQSGFGGGPLLLHISNPPLLDPIPLLLLPLLEDVSPLLLDPDPDPPAPAGRNSFSSMSNSE